MTEPSVYSVGFTQQPPSTVIDLSDVARISYAQNFEDVRLWKALGDRSERFFVDVGAGDPTLFSVTKLFSERGWTGINLEPGPNFERLNAERTDDVNLDAAIGSMDGSAPFYIAYPHPDLSSLHRPALDADPINVESFTKITVATARLETVLHEYAADTPIGFLKVDTESTELDVLLSNDWDRFRPLVVVVEAIRPGSHEAAFAHWEPVLLAAGYEFSIDDGINRFYARADLPQMRDRLAQPVSALDGYVQWPLVNALNQIEDARGQLCEAEARQALLAAAVERLTGEALDLKREAAAREVDLALDVAKHVRARQAVQVQLDGSMLVALERDRALKETTVELRARRAEISRHVEANVALINEARDWRVTAARLSASWNMRVGRQITRRAHRFEGLLAPVARAALARVRRARVRPDVVRSMHDELTVAGGPLQTVRDLAPIALDKRPAGSTASIAAHDLWLALATSRTAAPKILSDSEWDRIGAVDTTSSDVPNGLVGLVLLGHADPPERADGKRTTLVIDVTGAQIPFECGTRSHARSVLDEILAAVPADVRVQASSNPLYPPLEPAFLDRLDGEYDPVAVAEVGALVQLAPFINGVSVPLVQLLRKPGVRSAIVWLDAIIGLYPNAFLRDTHSFFDHQFGLECVNRHDWVLSLSDSSAAEAVRAGIEPERVLTTGCRSALVPVTAGAQPVGLAFEQYLLVVGNGLPHKNVAAAVAGFARVVIDYGGDLGLVVAANLTDEQRVALLELAFRLGVERHRVVVTAQLSGAAFTVLITQAEVTVVPSYHEGFSLPVIESTGVGTPVVVSDIAAHRELLGDGPWWFDPDDPVDLASAVLAVLHDPAQALRTQQQQLAERTDSGMFSATVKRVISDLCDGMTPWVDARSPASGSISMTRDKSLSLSKICELEDFTDPRLEPVIAEVFAHEKLRFGDGFPRGREYRKYWEVAMAVLTFKDCGLLDGTRRFLGIGAGNEPTLFHLTRHAADVLATDLYLADGWSESSNGTMLTDPGNHWPLPWVKDRLRVEHMDALHLTLPNASVAGVFSSSSIEHFGERLAVCRALDECYRVLEPGGVLSLSTEFRLRGDRPGIPGALLFDTDDIEELFVGDRGWELVEPFDTAISPATLATASSYTVVAADQQAQVARVGGLWTHHITYRGYPHIVLSTPTHTFTSFHLALRKIPRSPSARRRLGQGVQGADPVCR